MLLTSPLGKKMSWALLMLPAVAMVLVVSTMFLVVDWHAKERHLSDTVVPILTDLNSVYRNASSYRYAQNSKISPQAPHSAKAAADISHFNIQLLDVLEQRLRDNNSAGSDSLWSDLKSLWIEYTNEIGIEGADVGGKKTALTSQTPGTDPNAYKQFRDNLQTQQKNTEMELATSLAVRSEAFEWVVLSLATLLIVMVGFTYLVWIAFRSIGQQLGATPHTLHSIASQLASGSRDIESIVHSDSNTGLLSSLCEISLRLEEIYTENILARQFEREKDAKKIAEEAALDSVDMECDQETQKNCTKSQDECVKALELHKQITSDYKRRISALLETAKSVASGDLTKRSNVTGEDDVGRIAHWQGQIIDTIERNLQQFDKQAQMLKGSSSQLNTVNSKMRHSSVQTAEQANLASSSAEDISKTVDNVALAVKEMSASIREISDHSSEAAQVAEQAVTLAKDTDSTVRQLGDSSTSIGAVIKVINSIAEQTNLLALNATIEAARAGEAGKGFAVVANEVKELAKETAKATEEIAQQISTIQSDSKDAVSAISDIGKIIDRVNEIQSTIAAAVEEQSVTASEINRSIGDVSKGSSEIAQNVSLVADTAHESLDCVESAQSAVDQMICISSDLDELVASYRIARPNATSKAA